MKDKLNNLLQKLSTNVKSCLFLTVLILIVVYSGFLVGVTYWKKTIPAVYNPPVDKDAGFTIETRDFTQIYFIRDGNIYEKKGKDGLETALTSEPEGITRFELSNRNINSIVYQTRSNNVKVFFMDNKSSISLKSDNIPSNQTLAVSHNKNKVAFNLNNNDIQVFDLISRQTNNINLDIIKRQNPSYDCSFGWSPISWIDEENLLVSVNCFETTYEAVLNTVDSTLDQPLHYYYISGEKFFAHIDAKRLLSLNFQFPDSPKSDEIYIKEYSNPLTKRLIFDQPRITQALWLEAKENILYVANASRQLNAKSGPWEVWEYDVEDSEQSKLTNTGEDNSYLSNIFTDSQEDFVIYNQYSISREFDTLNAYTENSSVFVYDLDAKKPVTEIENAYWPRMY